MDMVTIIEKIQGFTNVQVRLIEKDRPFMDCVLEKKDVEACFSLIRNELGDPVKDFNAPVRLTSDIRTIVDQMGGIWKDQCLFLKKQEERQFLFAMFWPWQSDLQLVTLKIGVYRQT